ncbi:MAG: rRNA maturation RNase YbeY [Halobacteriovoraceae bacterium]|nr:rRNA maturation RNase YbeY [Halobacteriovoraceae bacterium]|tara:strand:+ start:14375 stop:14893 length:519 start_codon:yes stop_codon:yes gene_type:complete
MEKEFYSTGKSLELNLVLEEALWQGDIDGINKDLDALVSSLEDFQLHSLKNEQKFILNIRLCDEKEIIQLNSEHRNKNKKTDVLSFPLQDNIRVGEYDAFHGEIELGDIIICSEVCVEQAQEFKLSFEEEFYHLLVHGYLHLCGYDHEISEAEEKIMEELEEKILLDFKKKR